MADKCAGAGTGGADAGVSPLWRAAQTGRLASEWSRQQVEHAVQDELANRDRPWSDASSLYIAAANGWLECVRVLLEAKAAAELAGEPTCDRTPLRAAAQNGHVDVILLLLAHKAAPDISNHARILWKLPCSPLIVAIEKGHTQAVRVLVAAGADVNTTKVTTMFNKLPALLCAVGEGNLHMVRALVQGKAEVDREHCFAVDTALCSAAAGRHVGMVRLLLGLKADANRESHRVRPLVKALKSGEKNRPAIVRLLVRAKANVGRQFDPSTLPAPMQDALRRAQED